MATAVLSDADLAILRALANGPRTRQTLGVTRYRLVSLRERGFIKLAGQQKNDGTGGRRAIAYDLAAKGRKRV